ncbi:hypothetical protein SADUNF_Sadunf12G0019000 [Salix dunnii]|uniref:Uncharacterized protein n=1 Tax=Salix dunnii TaxID=1413687 RepID=A0A835MP20_9ROSI|nr:hypothetical protein SADUNF_Sadunf12G0019000 [Salix dunnii]
MSLANLLDPKSSDLTVSQIQGNMSLANMVGPKNFSDLCTKIMTCFSTNIPNKKKASMNLFGIAQQEDESTQEMLKVKELVEIMVLKVLIKRVRKHALKKKLYALPNRNLSKVN